MALNLFDNIFNQLTKQAPSQVPNFATPQAPRTMSYTQPVITPAKRNTTGYAPGWEGNVDESQNIFNRIMTPVETGIKALSQNIQQGGQQLSDISMQHSQNVIDRGYNQGYITLGQKIKAKNPQYSDMSDEELGRKIVAKYPQYQDIVDEGSGIISNPISGTAASIESGLAKGLGTMFGGISALGSAPLQDTGTAGVTRFAKGAMETGLGSAQLATSVMPTTMGAKALLAPTVNTLFSTDTAGKVLSPITEGIGTGIGMTQEALGFNPNSSVSKDIQNIGSTAGTMALLGGAQKGAGKVYEGVKNTGKIVGRGTEAITPTIVRGVKKITPTLPKAEELLVNQLEKTNRMNPTKYTEFQQLAGERAGKFMADRKITGDAESNVAKLYDNFTKSKAEADTGLDAIQKTYKSSELPSSMLDMMSELQKRFAYTKDTGALKTVSEAINKAENGTLSHSDINAIKRLYEQKVKVNYIKDQNSLEVERATNIDNDVRNWQFDEASKLGFDNLKLINKETQLNRYLADNIGEKIARQLGNNNISLTDWIIAGQVPATPQALALLAGKKLAQNVVPKLYQKGLEKIAKLPTKKAPVANIKNISKMEAIRKSVNPQYDTNRLLVSPRNSSRTPKTITPEVTLPTGEKGKQTIKSPAIKSDITSKSIIKRPSNESKVIKPKPKSVSVDTNNKQQVSNLEKEYVTKMKKGKNLVIDSDKIKEQFSDYDPKNPTTVHEKSSELSKIYYENALKDPSYKKVVLTAGGGGSGKSEILVSGIPQNSGTLVFDGTGKNFKKIVSQYDEAKKAGKDAEIKAVYIDYNKAKQFNAKRDRTVAEDILADTHKGYRKTLLQIAKERPDINISLDINLGVRDKNGNAISRRIPRNKIVNFLEAHQELER